MAAECTVGSCVANSSSSTQTQPNWWDDVHAAAGDGAGALSPWANPWQQQHQPNRKYSNSSNNNNNCDDHDQDVSISSASFTNGSNHSSLSVDSSGRLLADNQPSASSNDDLINGGEQVSDNHIWNHVLLSVNGSQDLNHNNDHDVGENFLDALSSKSLSSTAHHQHHHAALYEPAYCDYLKKLDNTNAWEFTNNNFNGGFMDNDNNNMNNINVDQSERLTKLSNLVSTWSIAPPAPQLVMDHHEHHHHQFVDDDAQMGITNRSNSMNLLSCYGGHNYLKVDHHQENLRAEYQIGLNHAMAADHLNSKYFYGNGIFMPPDSYSSSSTATSGGAATSGRNFADVISFTSRLAGNNKPLVDIHAPKPSFKSFNSSSDHSKKQGLQTSSSTRTSGGGRGHGIANEGKKKRDGLSSATVVLKKPKQESCTVSTSTSVKMQVPKVKLGDRITALQQIVSPFGKTDTASVLYEAIQYIKFLQDQVNVLLSSPYLKTNTHNKDVWGMDRKDHQDNGEGRQVDLKGKGLCLVPVSCTPQVYRENTGSDYWTPTYRGCLYR